MVRRRDYLFIRIPENTAHVIIANDRLDSKISFVTNALACRRLESVKIQKSFIKFVAAKFFLLRGSRVSLSPFVKEGSTQINFFLQTRQTWIFEGATTVSIMTLSIAALSIATLSIMILSIATLSLSTLSIARLSIATLSIVTLSITTLNIVTLSIGTLSIATLSIATCSIATLSIATCSKTLSQINVSVVMLRLAIIPLC
jgi:hypothetical protein